MKNINKSELMKTAWIYLKKWNNYSKSAKSDALKYAWDDLRALARKEEKLSDDLGVNSIYQLSWEDVKNYMSSLKKRTRTFWSIAKLVYENKKFTTHRSEFNALYHAVPKN